MRHDTKLKWVGPDDGEWFCTVSDCPAAVVSHGTWDEMTSASGAHVLVGKPRGTHFLFKDGGYRDAGYSADWLSAARRDFLLLHIN